MYELHVTINRRELDKVRLIQACDDLGVTPLFIENWVPGQGWVEDPVTSSQCPAKPYSELKWQVSHLRSRGFGVVRAKIEADPALGCPTTPEDPWGNPWQYLECHIRLETRQMDLEARPGCLNPLLISRRDLGTDNFRYYATLRRRLPLFLFRKKLDAVMERLRQEHWEPKPGHIEFAVHDPDGEAHDRAWVTASELGG